MSQSHKDLPPTEIDFGSKINSLQVLPYSGRILVSHDNNIQAADTSENKSIKGSHLKWLDPETLHCIDEYSTEDYLYRFIELPNKKVCCNGVALTLDCDEAANPGLASEPLKMPPFNFVSHWGTDKLLFEKQEDQRTLELYDAKSFERVSTLSVLMDRGNIYDTANCGNLGAIACDRIDGKYRVPTVELYKEGVRYDKFRIFDYFQKHGLNLYRCELFILPSGKLFMYAMSNERIVLIKDLKNSNSLSDFFRSFITSKDKVLRDDELKGIGYTNFQLAPDGKTVVSVDGSQLCFFNCETLESRVEDFKHEISDMTITPDGCIFVASGSKLISKDYAIKKLEAKEAIAKQSGLPAGVADIVTQFGFFSRSSEEIEQERIKAGLTFSL